MDFITIIGLLGTLVTIEEVGQGWLHIIKNKIKGRKIDFKNWDSTDSVVQRYIDVFKSSVQALAL